MSSEEDNMELENEAPFLAKLGKENPFITPSGYFDNLEEQILNQVQLNNLITQENKFKVPAGYFENLDDQIQSAIYLDRFKLGSAENSGFTVPAGYFAQSQERIQSKVNVKRNTAKLIRFSFARYAAAACILLTTSLGIYFNIKQNTSVDYQLSKVSAKEIESYLSQHTDGSDLPVLIENIDDTDLDVSDFNLENADQLQ